MMSETHLSDIWLTLLNESRCYDEIRLLVDGFYKKRNALRTFTGKLTNLIYRYCQACDLPKRDISNYNMPFTPREINTIAFQVFAHHYESVTGKQLTSALKNIYLWLFELDTSIAETNAWVKTRTDELDALSYAVNFQPEKEQQTMSIPKIETKTFINGTDVSELSDDAIFERIQKCEEEIKKLEAVANKPKKLQAKIDSIQAAITQMVELVDAR